MRLIESDLFRAGTTLLGFSGERVQPLEFISLPVSFCDDNGHTMNMVNFAVIRAKSGYNVILRRITLSCFGMAITTPHLYVKFPTSSGIVTIRGNVRQAFRCFQIAAQLMVDQLDPRETQLIVPLEGVINETLGEASQMVNRTWRVRHQIYFEDGDQGSSTS
ncbi:hypothetical protein AXF42_Ash004968 [Apostasia shenzhenica]|uniref:Uncharacterized protein n=1 Tax=Apostasia shenzhenica TaxID=1088818 RepID=A0A2I0B834_9ASPA|nr:hypothetical protein AXF42_Ash004968 [Apostasia shenzhenica]